MSNHNHTSIKPQTKLKWGPLLQMSKLRPKEVQWLAWSLKHYLFLMLLFSNLSISLSPHSPPLPSSPSLPPCLWKKSLLSFHLHIFHLSFISAPSQFPGSVTPQQINLQAQWFAQQKQEVSQETEQGFLFHLGWYPAVLSAHREGSFALPFEKIRHLVFESVRRCEQNKE